MPSWLESIPGVSYAQACVNEPNLTCTPSLCGKVFLLAQSNPWFYPTEIKLKKAEDTQKTIKTLFEKNQEELLKREKTTFFLPKILVNLSSHVGRIGLGVSLVAIIAPIGTVGNSALTTFYVTRFAVRRYGFGILFSKEKNLIQADWQKTSRFAEGALMDVTPMRHAFTAAGLYLVTPLDEVRAFVQFIAGLVALFALTLGSDKKMNPEFKKGWESVFLGSAATALLCSDKKWFECGLKAAGIGYLLKTVYKYSYNQNDAIRDFIPSEYRESIIKAIGLRNEFGLVDRNGFLLKVDPTVDAEEHKDSLLDRLFVSLEQKIKAECDKFKSQKFIIESQNPSYGEVMRKLEEIEKFLNGKSSADADLPAIAQMCGSFSSILRIQAAVAELRYPSEKVSGKNPTINLWKPSFMHSSSDPKLERKEKPFFSTEWSKFFDEFRQSSKGHANFMPNIPPAFQNPWKEELAKAAKNIGKEPIQLKDKKQDQQKIYESFRKMVLEGKSPEQLIRAGAIKNGLTQKRMYLNISLAVHPDRGAEVDQLELKSLFQILGSVREKLNIK